MKKPYVADLLLTDLKARKSASCHIVCNQIKLQTHLLVCLVSEKFILEIILPSNIFQYLNMSYSRSSHDLKAPVK